MRILFSSFHNPHFPTVTEYIEDALTALGHELITFDDRRHVIPGRIRQRIARLHKADLRLINRNLVKLAANVKPDAVIVAGGHRITPDTIEKLKALKVLTVLWTIDAPTDFQPILDAAAHYDNIFCQGTEAIEILKRAGVQSVHWLPMACDPQKHHRVELTASDKKKYQRDIVFVGSYYPNRWQILKTLKNFDLGIWGPNWGNVPAAEERLDFITDAKLKYEEWVKIYSAAKIVIIVHFNDTHVPCYQASPKLFEAMACGSFVLVDKQRDALALFEDGKHLACFDTNEALQEKTQYYLQNDSERKMIADNGYHEVTHKHTYLNRLQELLQKL
jgi:spore maturation protein CgeB